MSSLQTENEWAHSVRLDEIKTYLEIKGWQATPNPNARLLVYQGQKDDEGNPLEVVLTKSEHYVDTERRIAEVITTLAELEDRPMEQVAQEVASVDDDVVLWKIREPDGQQSISVELAASFLNGLQHLLTYSACLEDDPRPFFSRARAIGREFVQQCRFGHTRPGSFVFEMEAPLSLRNEQTFDRREETPFSRRVLQRLMRGLLEVHRVATSGDTDRLVRDYREGLNANAYETLSQMLEGVGAGGLECDFRWSPTLQNSAPSGYASSVRLGPEVIEYIRDAAKALRQMKPEADTLLRGRILRLGADADGTPRIITVETNVKGVLRHVRVNLEPGDYALACDAHRDSRPIRVSGTLERQGRTWRLLNVHGFALD